MVFVFLCISAVMHAEVQFLGVVSTRDGQSFALADEETGESRWVHVGESFNGFHVESFDAPEEILVMNRGSEVRRLKLTQAKVYPLPYGAELADRELFQRAYRAAVERKDAEVAEFLDRYQSGLAHRQRAKVKLEKAKVEAANDPEDVNKAADVEELEIQAGSNAAVGWLRSQLAKKVGL